MKTYSFLSGKVCFFVMLGKMSYFTFSPRKREEKRGKNALTPKYYIRFYASFFVEDFFFNKKGKSLVLSRWAFCH